MATKFAWHNDPDSSVISPSSSQFVLGPGVDSVIYNFGAVNTSSHPLSDVGFFIPFAWARVEVGSINGPLDHFERLTWNNTRNGFLDSNFNDTGESVLLTPSIVGHVAAGNVADLTDTHIFGPNSASVQIGIPASPFPPETIRPNDLLPFLDLGSFDTGQSKHFDITFTAKWDGADLGPVRVAGYSATLAPDQHGDPTAPGGVDAYNLVRFG